MESTSQNLRDPEERPDLFFGIISHKELAWSEHCAEIVAIDPEGLRIETREQIGPGYVWFPRRIRGNRGGFLEWIRPRGDRYCARIRFMPLSWNVKHYVRERARRSLPHRPLRKPADILALLSDPPERGTQH